MCASQLLTRRTPSYTMDDLPAELIAYIFTSFPDAGILSSAMLTCRKWYKHGARILHSKVVLNLRPGLTVGSPDTVVSFMKRLISPTLPTADYIHHLTISGFASPDIQELILNILSHTRALRSLNVCSLQLLQDSDVLIAPQVLPSTEFLPSLTALNATSATLSVSLAHTRRLRVMRVHEPMGEEQLRHLFRPGSPFAVQVQLLELALSVESTASAIASLTDLVSALAEAQLDGLALQFVSNRPGPPVSWKKFKVCPRSDSSKSSSRLTMVSSLLAHYRRDGEGTPKASPPQKP